MINNRGLSESETKFNSEQMRVILSRPHLHELAVESGFCRRSSKLTPEVFFEMLLYSASQTEQGSLYSEEFLPGFARILIKDSTKFMAPDTLGKNCKSCGGDVRQSSQAAISIQYEYDLKSGAINDLAITSGRRSICPTDSGKVRLLSLNKSLKTLKTLFDDVFSMFRESRQKSRQIAQYIKNRLSKNHWLESKKNKLCFPDISPSVPGFTCGFLLICHRRQLLCFRIMSA